MSDWSSDVCSSDLLASAIAGRGVSVRFTSGDEPAWTDGSVIHLQRLAPIEVQLHQLCVQCALVSADSLQAAILRLLLRRPELARRYLAVDGHRDRKSAVSGQSASERVDIGGSRT